MGCKLADWYKLKDKIEFLKNNNINKEIECEIRNILKNYYDDIEISSRIKEFNSAIFKYEERDYKNIEEIKDLIGIMIICKDINQIYSILEKIKENFNVICTKDYIKKPKMGYKSVHINIKDKNDYVYEIQLKTKSMQKAQTVIHDHIYKNKKIPKKLKEVLSTLMFNFIMKYEEFNSHKNLKIKRNTINNSMAF